MITGSRTGGDLVFLTWAPERTTEGSDTEPLHAYEEIRTLLEQSGSIPVQERVFCEIEAASGIAAARTEVLGDSPVVEVPPTFIEGSPTRGGPMAGIHVIAARPAGPNHVESVIENDVICGRRVKAANAVYLGLSDVGRLLATTQRSAAGKETQETLFQANRLLQAEGWTFSDVLRTWFYLDDILGWYDEFNQARNEVFGQLGLFNGSAPGLIPASTGIRGRNPRGHRCTLDLLAVQARPKNPVAVDVLRNPLQNEAPEYGSAFSRGLVCTSSGCRTFFISGTASIDETGRTVHPGDFDHQAQRTLDNIESLLASRGASMRDVCQATAFIKRREDFDRLVTTLRSRSLDALPWVFTVDDVCRDDLLVEIDATAIIPTHP